MLSKNGSLQPDSSGAPSPGDGLDAGALIVRLDGTIVSADETAARLFGYAPSQLAGRELKALMPPLRPGDEHAAFERLRRGVGIGPLQTFGRMLSGEPLRVSVTLRPLFGEDGAVDGVGVAVRALRPDEVATGAQASLAAIVDSSFDAIISKTLDGVITSWNRAAERLFGYSAEEAIGASILLIIPPDRRDEEENVLASIRRGEIVEPFETIRMHKGGAPVHVSLTISPVRDAGGRIIGASKIARDIGDRLRAEEERARMLRETQAVNRAKDEFLAMLGHELRNPLAAMTSALELLVSVEAARGAQGREVRAGRVAEVERLRLDDDLARHDAADVEHVVDQLREMLPLPLRDGARADAGRIRRAVLRERWCSPIRSASSR